MTECFGCVFSPRDKGERINEDFALCIQSWIIDKDLIGCVVEESGNRDYKSHVDFVIFYPGRSDNIRRSLFSWFKKKMNWEPEDDFEKSKCLKVTKQNNPAYRFGYCVKELEDKKDCWINRITFEEIEDHYSYYIESKGRSTTGKWECTSINQLPQYCFEYYKKISSGEFSNIVDGRFIKPSLRAIVIRLHTEGLVPFSLARKIKKSDELFFLDMLHNYDLGTLCEKLEIEDES